MAKKPAITGLPSGIVDDIIKAGVKGVKVAINTTNANKRYAKNLKPIVGRPKRDAFGVYPTTKQALKNKGALSYKKNIADAAKMNKKGK